MRMFLYARKSSYRGRKKRRGESVADQLDEGRVWGADNGVTEIIEYVDDDRSGNRRYSDKERKDFERLLADIASKADPGDVLWTWDTNRAQRDLAVYVRLRQACEQAGVLWHYNGRTYDLSRREDRRASAYDAVHAEDQVDELSENTKRGIRANARKGRPHGKGNYGYRRVYDSDTGDLLKVEIVEEQAKVVRDMAKAVKERRSLRSIGLDLDARGVPSPLGAGWSQQQIRRMVLNPVYIGKRTLGGEIVGDAMWPPILDERLFYECRAILMEPGRTTRRDAAVKYELSGVATCAVCEAPLWTSKHAQHGYRTYWCREYGHVSVKGDPVDEHVQRLLCVRFSRPDAAEFFATSDSDDEQTQQDLENIARWQSELADGEQLVKAGKLSLARFASIEQDFLPKIEAAEVRLARVRLDPLVADLIRPTAEEVFEVWVGMDIQQRRAVLRSVFEYIRISPKGRGRRNRPASEYVAHRWRGTRPD